MIRIKELRENSGLQQKDLAIDLGVTQPTISGWESGIKVPSAKNTEKIANYFGVSVDYVLGRSDKKKQPPAQGGGLTKTQKEAMQFIKGLSDEQLIRFIRMGKAAFGDGGDDA